MAIITGRDLSLTIDSEEYDDVASSVTLTQDLERNKYDVLSGSKYRTIDETGTLSIELFQDWGETGSVCEALWSAADTDPDTSLPFTFTANGGTFTGDVFPVKPAAGGAAPGELTVTVELTVDGSVTFAPAGD
jgi:hypothetical protein